MPSNVEKARARRMSLSFSDNSESTPQVQEYFLQVNYVGDVALAFMKGVLVQDEFYHGEPWTIGLKRYHNDFVEGNDMTFYFRPINYNAPFLRDLPKEAILDFSNGPVVKIKDVTIVPEYKIDIKF